MPYSSQHSRLVGSLFINVSLRFILLRWASFSAWTHSGYWPGFFESIKLRFISWIMLNSPWNLRIQSFFPRETCHILYIIKLLYCWLSFASSLLTHFPLKKSWVIKSYQLFLWSIYNLLCSSIDHKFDYATQGCPLACYLSEVISSLWTSV